MQILKVLKVDSETDVGLTIVLRQHRTRKFDEITQNNGQYAVQGHSRSPILYQSKVRIRFPISDQY